MASSLRTVVSLEDKEEDDFDWEAAVKEIDSACSSVSLTTRSEQATSRVPGKREKSTSSLRQATLDYFVGKIAKSYDGCSERFEMNNYSSGGISNISSNVGLDTKVAVDIDLEAAKTWVYPDNVSRRDYQFSISEKALYSNTLVALPTGLGKTLIAAVVMYNYFRWFPEGKIVFTAPSRPLVMQQIEACHNIVGMPQELTIDMTGHISPSKRIEFWRNKRVFFVTPQVLEKDIQTGTCLINKLVCLVVDEAHRASGNYSYCVVIRQLLALDVQLRILALTATPGSKREKVQNVINNLYISVLEYRDETNHDVRKYVHERKTELIKVAMDKDADEITSLLIQVIKQYVNIFSSKGILPHRDCTTMSPNEWIDIKNKVANDSTNNLSHGEKQKIMADIGMMSTLSLIRKLLLGYGIKMAYDMLEGKLKSSIARLCKNPYICKARDLMAKFVLSHGVSCPKLEKMIAVLVDHFDSKGSRDSRVMIFSSYRGSVRYIMNSLSQIGGLVRAAEFIGQSSGKNSIKGQNQKTQQAVLQKFRAGEYNVIVSTSIGEEGLDIIEVDLVICFDANISTLRMTQRMGRTGRKNDGRVVILASEGPDLNGYLRKQANGKSIKKQMHGGGIRSFDFHPSPRMVPHNCKPEVQFVKFNIDKFIPSGWKTKGIQRTVSSLSDNLSNWESDLIIKYFHRSGGVKWKPSLIAFPRFQALPSRIHRVRHSLKTTEMFNNAMEFLQVVPFSKANNFLPVKMDTDIQEVGRLTLFYNENCQKGAENLQHETSYHEASYPKTSTDFCANSVLNVAANKPRHQFLFGANIVSVNTFGEVMITSVPVLPFNTTTGVNSNSSKKCRIKSTCFSTMSVMHDDRATMFSGDALLPNGHARSGYCYDVGVLAQKSQVFEERLKEEVDRTDKTAFQKVVGNDNTSTQFNVTKKVVPSLLACASTSTSLMDLSPQLTQFIEKGFVPESPIKDDCSLSESDHQISSCCSPRHENCGLVVEQPSESMQISSNMRHEAPRGQSIIPGKKYSFSDSSYVLHDSSRLLFSRPTNGMSDLNDNGTNMQKNGNLISPVNKVSTGIQNNGNLISPVNKVSTGIQNNWNLISPVNKVSTGIQKNGNLTSPVNKVSTSPTNRVCSDSPNDWPMNSGGSSTPVNQVPKYKRLRKQCDIVKKYPDTTSRDELHKSQKNFYYHADEIQQRDKTKEVVVDAKAFIDDEAEVSEDANMSEDEIDEKNDIYDCTNSFIDDRSDLTGSTTQEESSSDMMAFYRRSLLTQSPLETPPSYLPSSSNIPASSISRMGIETKDNDNFATPGTKVNYKCQFKDHHSAKHLISERIPLFDLTSETNKAEGDASTLGSRKRKLSYQYPGTSTEEMHRNDIFHLNSVSGVSDHILPGAYCDDHFYENLDLDALEAQATDILRRKADLSERQESCVISIDSTKSIKQSASHSIDPPSFDLGI